MFISIRKYQGVGSVEELTRRVEQGFVPIVKQIPGLKNYQVIHCGGGVVASISVFDNRESALMSNERARAWVQENLMDLVSDPPETTAGTVIIDVRVP